MINDNKIEFGNSITAELLSQEETQLNIDIKSVYTKSSKSLITCRDYKTYMSNARLPK